MRVQHKIHVFIYIISDTNLKRRKDFMNAKQKNKLIEYARVQNNNENRNKTNKKTKQNKQKTPNDFAMIQV